MSDEQQLGLLTRAYRTVTPGFGSHPDAEMDSIGWAIFLGLIVIFLPLLPFIALVWLVTKAFDAVARRFGGGGDARVE